MNSFEIYLSTFVWCSTFKYTAFEDMFNCFGIRILYVTYSYLCQLPFSCLWTLYLLLPLCTSFTNKCTFTYYLKVIVRCKYSHLNRQLSMKLLCSCFKLHVSANCWRGSINTCRYKDLGNCLDAYLGTSHWSSNKEWRINNFICDIIILKIVFNILINTAVCN